MSSGVDLHAVGRDGWAVVDLLERTEVDAVAGVVSDLSLDPTHPFFASPAQAWGELAAAVDRRLKQFLGPAVRRALPGRRIFLAGVTSKGAREGMEIRFHQDWTYTDERTSRAVFLWCPLVDVDRGNGGLAVVPGSHRWSDAVRPARRSQVVEDLQDELRALAVDVPLAAGQAIAFDPATFHGSGPNSTGAARPAVTVATVVDNAELLHFHEDDAGTVTGWAVDDEFFTRNPYGCRPEGYPRLDPPDRVTGRREFIAALAAARPGIGS